MSTSALGSLDFWFEMATQGRLDDRAGKAEIGLGLLTLLGQFPRNP